MSKSKKSTIDVQGTAVTVLSKEQDDYISLTDMVKNFDGGSALIEQWLKEDENRRLSLDWNLNRTLAKVNYRIHTDAIKEKIIPSIITKKQESLSYANEADIKRQKE